MVQATLGERIKAAVKAFQFGGWDSSGGIGSGYPWWGALLPGAKLDYQSEVGELWKNSAVAACVGFIARTFPEAPIQICRHGGLDGDNVDGHPLASLLEAPNGDYSGPLLWMATLLSWTVSGNAYWVKLRGGGGAGRVMGLYYVPHFQIAPQWPTDGSEYISHYLYQVDGRQVRLPREDVVHFRNGLDPSNYRLGLSPLASVLREVVTDNEASTYAASILRNMGVPGIVITPKNDDAVLLDGDAEAIKRKFMARFTGDERGKPLVMSVPLDLHFPGFSPSDLMLDKVRDIPEERICAVLGIPPSVVGLGAGLDNLTYNNLEQARRIAYENNIIPTQRLFAAELTSQLLPDFESDSDELYVRFDNRQVHCLQDDLGDLYTRVGTAFEQGLITRDEARAMIGVG
jgi:HK97 family phage portal protein